MRTKNQREVRCDAVIVITTETRICLPDKAMIPARARLTGQLLGRPQGAGEHLKITSLVRVNWIILVNIAEKPEGSALCQRDGPRTQSVRADGGTQPLRFCRLRGGTYFEPVLCSVPLAIRVQCSWSLENSWRKSILSGPVKTFTTRK